MDRDYEQTEMNLRSLADSCALRHGTTPYAIREGHGDMLLGEDVFLCFHRSLVRERLPAETWKGRSFCKYAENIDPKSELRGMRESGIRYLPRCRKPGLEKTVARAESSAPSERDIVNVLMKVERDTRDPNKF